MTDLPIDTPSLSSSVEEREPLRERTLSMFWLGAVGDALGAPIEFSTHDEIVRKWGSTPPQSLVPEGEDQEGKGAPFTDDTQMTLFCAEGLIRAKVRGERKGICSPPAIIRNAYLRWLMTQEPVADPQGFIRSGALIEDRRLHRRMAPGNTCISALQSALQPNSEIFAENDSKGCGTIMRTAPTSLIASPRGAFSLACEQAALTHGHPTAWFASGAFSLILWTLLREGTLAEGIVLAREALRGQRGAEETREALDLGERWGREDGGSADDFQRIGGGWTAESALCIALACAGPNISPGDSRAALWRAAAHSGDSDSTATLAGQLLGARFGFRAVDEQWLDEVEALDLVTRLASDLHDALVMRAPSSWCLYPGV